MRKDAMARVGVVLTSVGMCMMLVGCGADAPDCGHNEASTEGKACLSPADQSAFEDGVDAKWACLDKCYIYPEIQDFDDCMRPCMEDAVSQPCTGCMIKFAFCEEFQCTSTCSKQGGGPECDACLSPVCFPEMLACSGMLLDPALTNP